MPASIPPYKNKICVNSPYSSSSPPSSSDTSRPAVLMMALSRFLFSLISSKKTSKSSCSFSCSFFFSWSSDICEESSLILFWSAACWGKCELELGYRSGVARALPLLPALIAECPISSVAPRQSHCPRQTAAAISSIARIRP